LGDQEKRNSIEEGMGNRKGYNQDTPWGENDTLISISLKGTKEGYREDKFYLRLKVV
jgi:hypothetical protein